MAVEDLEGSHPVDPMIQDPNQDERDLGKEGEVPVDEAQGKTTQDEEAQVAEAQLRGSNQEQEDIFDDGFP